MVNADTAGQTEPNTTHRWIIAAVATTAALVLGLGIAIVVALNAQTAAVLDQSYRECITQAGLDSSTAAEDMVTIANRCTSLVYGD